MKSAKLLFTQLALVLATFSARAENLFIEPYGGVSKMDVIYTPGTAEIIDIGHSFFFGGRGGFQSGMLLVGADYQTGTSYKFHQPLGDAKWEMTMLGGGIGLVFSYVSLWGGYYPKMEIDDAKFDRKFEGTAIKAGVGFLITRIVRANLEFIHVDIDKVETNGVSQDEDDYKVQVFQISLSAPFSF